MANIKDVAKLAQVSPSTVSLVINNSNLVKMETKYRVLQACKELNYIPNQYARSLVTKCTKVIGVVFVSGDEDPNIIRKKSINTFDVFLDMDYFGDILSSIQNELDKVNYGLLFEWIYTGDGICRLPCIMDSNRVDGVLIVGGSLTDAQIEYLMKAGIPTVLVGTKYIRVDYVDTDVKKGIYIATKYLIENNHRNIAFVKGPAHSRTTSIKMDGFLEAMESSGIQYRHDWIYEGNYSGKTGYDAINKIWSNNGRPTAVVCSAVAMAAGILRFLYQKGLNCPNDLSIVGYEDGILAAYMSPPLTSVHTNRDQMASEACKVLFNRINNPKAKNVGIIIEPDLQIYDSVKQI